MTQNRLKESMNDSENTAYINCDMPFSCTETGFGFFLGRPFYRLLDIGLDIVEFGPDHRSDSGRVVHQASRELFIIFKGQHLLPGPDLRVVGEKILKNRR